MLSLFKAYFDAAGMADSAALILPSNGMFATGEFTGGFGTIGTYYLGNDGTIHFGPVEENFYNYLVTMRDWYQKGYIYTDFASRTNDPFYLPNPALTYGGSAGMWWGLVVQLGDRMSMPEYGLNMDVQPVTAAPIDEANGITKETALKVYLNMPGAQYCWAITNKCKNIEQFLTAVDWLYSDEGSHVKSLGLDVAHGSETDPVLQKLDLAEGCWWLDDSGNVIVNSKLDWFEGGTLVF